MPKEKLTLSADKKVVEEAKKIAREKNTSISAIFSNYIMTLSDLRQYDDEITPIARKASGIVSIPKEKSDKKLLEDALWNKYGKKK